MNYKKYLKIRKYFNYPMWSIKILIKKLLLKLNLRSISFCKECGVDTRDFLVPDNIWEKVTRIQNGSGTLCYNCFCDKCSENNIEIPRHLNYKEN